MEWKRFVAMGVAVIVTLFLVRAIVPVAYRNQLGLS